MRVGVQICPRQSQQKHCPASHGQRAVTHTLTAAWRRDPGTCLVHTSKCQPGQAELTLLPSLGAVVAEVVAENYEASGGRGEAETEAWKKENTQAGKEEGALSFSKVKRP